MEIGGKYLDFLRHDARGEFLEGTTAAGKTTVGALKFMLKVAESKSTQHILAGLDLGTIEKNVIAKPHGILDEFGSLAEYHGNGTAKHNLPHISFAPAPHVEKIIYVLGYADKARWKKALGGQYGCMFLDEANIADMDFVREATMRCDYFIATLNPDSPDLPIYSEYINKAVPMHPETTPPEILKELDGTRPEWSHWFFGFEDNVALSPAKIERIKRSVPEGTKLWKNKVLGLRGKATGLVFGNYDPARHDMTYAQARELADVDGKQDPDAERFVTYTSGLDTAYSQKSSDSFSMTFGGITNKGRFVLLDCREYNNAGRATPLAPTDIVGIYTDFLARNRREWGLARHVFVDSADQATLMELRKWKRANPACMHVFEPAHKKLPNIDRIELQLGWFGMGDPAFMLLAENCQPYVRELGAYSWDESKDSTPEDANDHSIQSCQYAWLPYRERIGR